LLFHTGLAIKVIDGVERLIRQVPGRLAVVRGLLPAPCFSAILRFHHRDHGDARLADAAGDAVAPAITRRWRRVRSWAIGAVDMLNPAIGADRAARLAVRHLDLEASDRRRGAGG